MTDTVSAPAPGSSAAGRPPSAPTRTVVVAVEARSRTEWDLLARWSAAHHPGAPLVRHDRPEDLAHALSADGDVDVVPVRVTWLPAGREPGAGRGLRVVLRRSLAVLQPLARKRTRITLGAPGRRSDLPVEEVREYGRACLGELAAVQRELGLEVYQAFMRPMHAQPGRRRRPEPLRRRHVRPAPWRPPSCPRRHVRLDRRNRRSCLTEAFDEVLALGPGDGRAEVRG